MSLKRSFKCSVGLRTETQEMRLFPARISVFYRRAERKANRVRHSFGKMNTLDHAHILELHLVHTFGYRKGLEFIESQPFSQIWSLLIVNKGIFPVSVVNFDRNGPNVLAWDPHDWRATK